MKKFIIVVLLAIGLLACCSCSEEARQKRIAEKVEIGKHHTSGENSKYIGRVKLSKTGDSDIERNLHIIEVDGHEYLVINGYRAVGICHYESCKYCKK